MWNSLRNIWSAFYYDKRENYLSHWRSSWSKRTVFTSDFRQTVNNFTTSLQQHFLFRIYPVAQTFVFHPNLLSGLGAGALRGSRWLPRHTADTVSSAQDGVETHGTALRNTTLLPSRSTGSAVTEHVTFTCIRNTFHIKNPNILFSKHVIFDKLEIKTCIKIIDDSIDGSWFYCTHIKNSNVVFQIKKALDFLSISNIL